MKSSNYWQNLTVEAFLSDFAWQRTHSASQSSPVKQENWRSQTVTEFLSQSNWQGLTQAKSQLSFSLNLPVKEFWQFFTWEEKPHIAVFEDKPNLLSPETSPNSSFSLENFTNLF